MEQKRCKKCGCWIDESWIGMIEVYETGTYCSKTKRLCRAHKLEQLYDEDREELEKLLMFTRE